MGKRPAEELYDMKTDLPCLHNLAGNPAYAQVKARLWDDLQKKLIQQQDPRILGNGVFFDSFEYVGKRDHAWDTIVEGKALEVKKKGRKAAAQ